MVKRILSLLEKVAFDEDEKYGFLRLLPLVFFIITSSVLLLLRVFWGWEVFIWEHFRFFVIPVLAFLFVFVFGAFYVQDIYKLESPKTALRFMVSTFWGIALPSWDISANTDYETLQSIRGPGYINVKPGTIVVVENLKKPTDVFGANKHKIKRFQYIRASFDLGEKEKILDKDEKKDERIKTITKDALEISLGIKYRFRFLSLRDGENLEHFSQDPYPFSMRAAFNLAYKKNKKDSTAWENAVKGIISSTVANYIKKGISLEKLAALRYTDKAPSDEIKSRLSSLETRSKLKDVGAELLWLDVVGTFDFGELKAREYQKDKWLEEWNGKSELIRAQGEAELLANQERGRAEGQVELLRSVSRALNEISEGSNNELNVDENLRRIVLARIVQVIEAMTSIYDEDDEQDGDKEDERKQ